MKGEIIIKGFIQYGTPDVDLTNGTLVLFGDQMSAVVEDVKAGTRGAFMTTGVIEVDEIENEGESPIEYATPIYYDAARDVATTKETSQYFGFYFGEGEETKKPQIRL